MVNDSVTLRSSSNTIVSNTSTSTYSYEYEYVLVPQNHNELFGCWELMSQNIIALIYQYVCDIVQILVVFCSFG